MALVSHVPHVLAAALINQAAATAPGGREALRSAGPSFDDLTRVAGANPPLWADILLANRDAVLDALSDYRGRLEQVESAIVAGDRDAVTRSAGPSFDDLTRVAGANPPLWADILLANRDAVVAALGDYRGRLSDVEDALRAGDRARVVQFVGAAADGRRRLRAGRDADGAAAEPWEIVVGIPDRPGAVSEITTALGHGHINIADLALRPGPPEAWASSSCVWRGPRSPAEAVALISALGLRAEAGPA